jgi:oligopeptide/dipeptide ABC transporter ATP-binding protein
MRDQELLCIEDLRVHFKTPEGVVQALSGVTIRMRHNEILGLVGETGSGKSVTALSVLRLVPIPPARHVGGSITFEGQDLFALSRDEMRRIRGKQISMIFQEPRASLDPVFKVGEQIAEGIRLYQKEGSQAAMKQAIRALELVGMPDPVTTAKRYPHELSGGMQQRVMIATALACNPKLLIADEPTSSLDVTIQAQILELLKNLRARKVISSVLLITHDFGVVAEICERVAVMYAGNIVEVGDVEAVFEHHMHPYTAGLFASIINVDENQGALGFIPGSIPDLIDPPRGCRFHPRCSEAMAVCAQVRPDFHRMSEGHYVACHQCARTDNCRSSTGRERMVK